MAHDVEVVLPEVLLNVREDPVRGGSTGSGGEQCPAPVVEGLHVDIVELSFPTPLAVKALPVHRGKGGPVVALEHEGHRLGQRHDDPEPAERPDAPLLLQPTLDTLDLTEEIRGRQDRRKVHTSAAPGHLRTKQLSQTHLQVSQAGLEA